jgi:nucleotide-binding universal stress UspA family protein
MSFKDVLVHVEAGATGERRLQYAIELARQHEAHLSGLFVIEPLHLGAYFTPPAASYVDVAALEEIDRKHREAEMGTATQLEARFRGLCTKAAIGADWHVAVGDARQQMTLNARCVDLAILGQIDPDHLPTDSAEQLPEQTSIASGRPTLVVPYAGEFNTVGRNVLLAWSHTREAAHAANDALPILKRAEKVTVLMVNPEGAEEERDVPALDIAQHLARHGVKAEAAFTVAKDVDIADILLSRASDLDADMLVMGCYGHSRLREFVLGGTTRMILREMTVPVFMSH